MRHAAGEVPKITLLKVIDEVTTLVVDRGNTDFSIEDVSPLSLLMPVQFANDALVETHIHTGQLDTRAQLSNSCLSRPSAFLRSVSARVGLENGI